MQTDRRNFLRTIGAAAAFTAAGGLRSAIGQDKDPSETFPIPPEAYSSLLYSLTSKQMETFIGQTFTAVSSTGRSVRLTLTEVNVLERFGNTVRGYYGECYSLIFEGGGKAKLTQDVYDMHVNGLENFSALMVPTGLASRQFEIVVNHVTR